MDSRILVVEDSAAGVALLERLLGRAGYRTLTAVTDPRDAIETYDRLRPDIVLLDLRMPHVDGFHVLSAIRARDESIVGVPVVMLTADTALESRRLALGMGASDFLTKPLDGAEVLLRVRNLLQSRFLHLDLMEQNRLLETRVRERTSELQAAYETERTAAARLRELERMKHAFLLAISHELRTPLTSVVGFARMLELRGAELGPERVRDLVERLVTNAVRLEQLLLDILDVERLTRRVIEPRRRPVDVAALASRVVGSLDLNGHVLHTRLERLTMDVDPALVERIIENLLSNAIKHTPAGSQIWLSITRTAVGAELGVADDGPGVPDADKQAVFEHFRQAATIDHSPGTGIGLSLVAGFAGLHGGRAWVEDRPGGGAWFRVSLPVEIRTPPSDAGGVGELGPTGPPPCEVRPADAEEHAVQRRRMDEQALRGR